MTEEVLQPNNLIELQEIIKGSERKLLPRGGGTKPALSRPPEEAQTLDLSSLFGITKYTPGEFTFTALSGTPVKEIESALQELRV